MYIISRRLSYFVGSTLKKCSKRRVQKSSWTISMPVKLSYNQTLGNHRLVEILENICLMSLNSKMAFKYCTGIRKSTVAYWPWNIFNEDDCGLLFQPLYGFSVFSSNFLSNFKKIQLLIQIFFLVVEWNNIILGFVRRFLMAWECLEICVWLWSSDLIQYNCP